MRVVASGDLTLWWTVQSPLVYYLQHLLEYFYPLSLNEAGENGELQAYQVSARAAAALLGATINCCPCLKKKRKGEK